MIKYSPQVPEDRNVSKVPGGKKYQKRAAVYAALGD
jgi:hypothetical protein